MDVAERTAWKLVKSEQGIKVFQAPVKGSDYDVYRLETVVSASLSALVAINSDAENIPRWMDSLESNKKLSGDEKCYVTHTKTKVPWPAKNRDAVIETRIEQNPDTLQVTMKFQAKPQLIPKSKDYERVNHVQGFWQFTPLESGKTQVVYQNHAEAGGMIPGWIANMFGVDVPFKSVRNMVKELQKPGYRDVRVGFIVEP